MMEANKFADKARKKAWNYFKARYPKEDLSKFSAQVSSDDKRQATAEIYFNRSDGVHSSVSGSDRRYWDDDVEKAFGIGGFLLELTLNRIGKKEVLVVPFNKNSVGRLNEEIKIFVTPSQYFNAKFGGIFT